LSRAKSLPARVLSRPVLDGGALVLSAAMLASLLPSIHLSSLVQVAYYLVVPGFALLRLVNNQMGSLDRVALTLVISLGLVVGFSAFFQSFYPLGTVNQSLVIPLLALVASAISLRASTRRKKE
jgi:uncharacterized membrane protein